MSGPPPNFGWGTTGDGLGQHNLPWRISWLWANQRGCCQRRTINQQGLLLGADIRMAGVRGLTTFQVRGCRWLPKYD